jgi:hypothetical protein
MMNRTYAGMQCGSAMSRPKNNSNPGDADDALNSFDTNKYSDRIKQFQPAQTIFRKGTDGASRS